MLATPVLRADDKPAANQPAPREEMRNHDQMADRMLDQREHRKEMGERMAKELGLTAEQKTKMKSLLRQQREAAEAIMDDEALSRDQKRAKLHELGQSYEGQRRAVLTPDQQKKAAEMRARFHERLEERRERMRHHRARDHGRDEDRPRD